MNRYLKNLNRIEFVITMACTGRCKHCSQGEHRSSDYLDENIAEHIVRSVAGEYNVNSVMTFGGEPLLYPDTVCAIHNVAKQMNIPHRQLITNGYFSKDSGVIKSVAERIINSGVNEILLSVDAFHQETIPLEYVKIFAENVKNNTGARTEVHPAWLISSNDNNKYNIQTRELLREFIEMGIEISEGNVIFPSGNALKYLGEYFDLSKNEKNPYQEDPSDIRAICIGADGDVLGGNIYSRNIRDILSSYMPE